MDQQPKGFAEGLDKLQQEAVVHISPLPAQPPKPASSQSITDSTTGERPHSRALSVMGTGENQPQSTPPLADHHQQSRISTNSVSPSAHADTHRHHSKILGCICLNYLFLYSQKTDTAPALTMTRTIVMQKLA